MLAGITQNPSCRLGRTNRKEGEDRQDLTCPETDRCPAPMGLEIAVASPRGERERRTTQAAAVVHPALLCNSHNKNPCRNQAATALALLC